MTARKNAPAVEATTNGAGKLIHGIMHAPNDSISKTSKSVKCEPLFIRAPELMELIGVSRSTAGRILREVNNRQKARNLFTMAGACNRRAVYEYLGLTVKD